MDNFTAIRNGLLDHALTGKLSPFDFGLYVFLIMRADYSTGIYRGCALTIAWQFGDPSQKRHIQKSLRRLRDKKFLNYRNGDGTRGAYPILINKFSVTVGELSGTRLNACKHNGLATPEYEPENGHGTVVAPNKDLKTKDVKDLKDEVHVRERTTFQPPTLQQVSEYCQQRQKNVNPETWMDYYLSNGWKVGRGNPMKDWKAAVRYWERNQKGNNHANAAERRQNNNLSARDTARASIMAGR